MGPFLRFRFLSEVASWTDGEEGRAAAPCSAPAPGATSARGKEGGLRLCTGGRAPVRTGGRAGSFSVH